jgi:hypothetical protein
VKKRKAFYKEITQCVVGECPFSEWQEDANGPDGIHCNHPQGHWGLIISDNEVERWHKEHKGKHFPFHIPKDCPLDDYDLFYAAVNAIKEKGNEQH